MSEKTELEKVQEVLCDECEETEECECGRIINHNGLCNECEERYRQEQELDDEAEQMNYDAQQRGE